VLPGEGPGPGWEHRRSLPTDEALLFRFSALTYNAHRIHYDLPYATAVEGYPGLVVQGPLQAMALAALARDVLAQDGRTGGGLGSFAFRALAPAFCGTTLELVARPGGLGLELAAYDGQGRRTMEAAAEPPAAAFHADQEDAR
jgi:3-methylfumaryl-CoA hydratase